MLILERSYAILTTNETTLERPVNKANRGSLSFLLDGVRVSVFSPSTPNFA